jgi:hypothetical protein
MYVCPAEYRTNGKRFGITWTDYSMIKNRTQYRTKYRLNTVRLVAKNDKNVENKGKLECTIA